MSIFSRAYAGLPLTPAERAFLKLLKGMIYTALIAGAQAGLSEIILGNVNWRHVGYTALITTGFTLLTTLSKYFTAHGDQAAATLFQQQAQQLQQIQPPQQGAGQ